MEQVMIDFYNGATMLQRLVAWSYVEANQRLVLDQIVAFAEAYEKLVQLHIDGKLAAGECDLSQENLERVKRLVGLIQAGFESDEIRSGRQELHDLADRCVQGLTSASDFAGGRDEAENPAVGSGDRNADGNGEKECE